MSEVTIARSGKESSGYVDKGRGLFGERFEEFRYLGRGRWIIPSATTPGRHYEVSTRGEGSCECLGFGYHRHCCRQVAVDLARLKTSTCNACGERFLNHEIVEVAEEHLEWTLAFFLGERVCQGCAGDHGLL